MHTETRLFFATDIHGSEVCFRKFVNAASAYRADVLILGGDITGKQLVPIRRTGARWTAHEGGREVILESQRDVTSFKAAARAMGGYPISTTVEEEEALRVDEALRERRFREAVVESVSSWLDLAEERLSPLGVQCHIGLGNDDDRVLEPVLRDHPWVRFPEGVVESLGGHEMISWGWSNVTPWRSPREQEEAELEASLERLARALADPAGAIFNLHVPPWQSGLDTAPAIDDQFRMILRGGSPEMVPVGSTAVRCVVEQFQPLLGLHGHVHESRAATKLGRTVCLNPGSDYNRGILRGVMISLKRGKVRNWAFTTG